MNGEYIERIFDRYKITAADEYGVQNAITQAFYFAGQAMMPAVKHDLRREVQIGPGDRIDFLIDRIGIEVKVAGQPAKVADQLRRYADTGCLSELVLVTTRSRHTTIRAGWDRTVSCPLRVIVLSPL